MIPTPYKCHHCGREGIAKASDDGDREWNATLAKLLVCDWCADYLHGKRGYGCAIANVCAQVRGRQLTKPDQEVEEEARIKLRKLTWEYAQIICRYRRVENVWEQDFVEQLVERPDMCWVILRAYEDGLRQTAKLTDDEFATHP